MADFKPFGALVRSNVDAMMQCDEAYVADVDTHDMWDHYLASFPEGTNPHFRERTEHDCSCCRHFIRNVGHFLTIQDNRLITIWDGMADMKELYPYNVVAESMADYVRSAGIKNLYRTRDGGYGAEETRDNINPEIMWNHFHADVDPKFVLADKGPLLSRMESTYNVFKRGLEELRPTAFIDVLDLIESNSIYRGQEHERSVRAFQEFQQEYSKLNSDEARSIFIWENIRNPFAGFRNTVIGTLITDLSDGVGLEEAVKKFEAKVAPENYKRPKALITPRMIESAVTKLEELGLSDAVKRRYATLADVSVNNVLFVDNEARSQMKDGLRGLLMEEAKAPVRNYDDAARPISMDDFLKNVIPNTTSLELILQNDQLTNLVSLTAPEKEDTGGLFQWDNDFAWSYDGGLADSSLRAEVARLGGRVDGVFRFSHTWNYDKRNASLMDLHVFMPGNSTRADNGVHDGYGNNQRVGWNQRKHHQSGGVQDVDYVQAAPEGYVPVENITFPTLAKLKDGQYICKIHNWNLRRPTQGGFRAEIEFDGQVFEYEYDKPLKHKEWVTVAVVTLRHGVFSIEHKLEPLSSSKDKWGIKTLQPTKVTTLMMSPNYWDGQSKGNKHWFFMLEDCINPDRTRGMYNEFLTPKLQEHRKVFEVLGDKTKCEPSPDQLSGAGFSSTRKDKVIVLADGKPYEITF